MTLPANQAITTAQSQLAGAGPRRAVYAGTPDCANAWPLWSFLTAGSYSCEPLESGRSASHSANARLGPLELIYENIDRSVMRHRDACDRKLRMFVVRLQTGPTHYVNGYAAPPLSICLEPTDLPSAAICRGGLEAITIEVDEQALRERLHATSPGRSLPSSGCSQTNVLVAPELAQRLIAKSTAIIEFVRTVAGCAETPLALSYIQTMLDLLLECVTLEDAQPSRRSGAYFPALTVQRAHDYALTRLAAPITVLELCKGLRVSRRTLQRSFREVTGMSPARYLLQLRLNRVHRDLLEQPGCVSVQDVATRWGFLHLSRFAQFYRRAFGELPSQTQKFGSALRQVRLQSSLAGG
jgi:AraC-like DNA-binding protein